MRTGFISSIIALLLSLAAGAAGAVEVSLVGMIGQRAAVLAVNGGNPKTVKLNQTWNGITLLALGANRATVEIDGQRRELLQAMHYGSAQASPAPARPAQALLARVALTADDSGHFTADASVNGRPMRFLVDTGASVVALPASEARRLGIDYRNGARSVAQTANGAVPVYRVSLERVRIGGIELRAVDGMVVEHGLDVPLLGMSFLTQVNMKLEGATMTLTQR